MRNVIEWLNSNAGAIQGIATIVLAIIAASYFGTTMIQRRRSLETARARGQEGRPASKVRGALEYAFALIFGLLIVRWAVVNYESIQPGQWLDFLPLTVLILVTYYYATETRKIAEATKEQAQATMKMAEEMKEQRLQTTRPMIIQKAINQGIIVEELESGPRRFHHFLLVNVGNGPAIEVRAALLDKNRKPIYNYPVILGPILRHDTFLRSGDRMILPFTEARMFQWEEATQHYLVSEYQDIFDNYHQTWLPFEIVKTKEAYEILVLDGKMELRFNVAEQDRIDNLGSKPQ